MDITERKITKIAREAEKLVLRTLREKDVGTAEIDLIHALRHNPGCTQAALAELLHADKAAIARRTRNLETKGYLVRKDAPNDRRSQLLYPTEKAEGLKASKAEIEAAFYEYLTSALTPEEAAAFAAALDKLYTASKTESRAGFPHFHFYANPSFAVRFQAVPHTVVVDAAVAPTYTESGLTEGAHCSICGTVLIAQEIIPKLEELLGDVNGDGKVNILDVDLVYQYLLDLTQLDARQMKAANVTGSDDIIDVYDLQRLYEAVAGISPLSPPSAQ